MHHLNADAPPDGSPRPAALPGQPPPTGARPSGGRMPPTTLSGYEQILAARAAMRADVRRADAVERLGFLAPAARDPRRVRRRAEPRRRPGLILSGLAAVPACALLALAWVEPPRAPQAFPAGPATVAGTSPFAFDVAAAATAVAPVAEAGGSVSTAQGPDARSWTVEATPGTPRGGASSEPEPRPERAEAEPAPPPMEQAGPALAAGNQDAPPPAVEPDPAGPSQVEAPRPMLARAEAEEAAGPAPAVAGAAEEEPASAVAEAEEAAGPVSTVAEAEEEEPAPTPFAASEAEEPAPASVAVAAEVAGTADDGSDAEAVAVGNGAASALPDTVEADAAALLRARQKAPPAEAPAEAKPALPPAKLAVRAEPPPSPPPVGAAPAKSRTGDVSPAPPARAVRVADGASPPAEARCRAIIVKFQLGEETSHADRSFLQTSCGARRR